MPNDENRIILEFPASDVQLELGETITFDNISGFLNSDRVTYDDESLTEKISTMNSEIDSKADAGATSQALDAKADKVETEQALATKADKTFVDGEVARLDERIDALPDAMIFKGTLGVGGTITELPTASAENEGWTYKVITAGTYAGLYADVGDCFTCFEASENVFGWTISAEGDTDTDTWRAIKVNGVEKLGNGISSGNVDFEDTANVKFTFDGNGNKIKASLSGIDTSAQVDAKVAGLIDDTQASTEKVYSSSKVAEIVENAVDSVLPTDSVSKSAIATFETDLAKPMSLKAYIEATQDLHGQSAPYPSGGQLWDEEWEIGNIDTTTGQNTVDNQRIRSVNYIPCEPATRYFCKKGGSGNIRYFYYDADKNFISSAGFEAGNQTFITAAGAYFMRFICATQYGTTYNNDISLNTPHTDTAYHPYSNICPIGGWDSVKVGKTGKNLLNPNYFANQTTYYEVNNDGSITVKSVDGRAWTELNTIPMKKGTYTYSRSVQKGAVQIRTSLNNYASNLISNSTLHQTFTLSNDCFIKIKLDVNATGEYPITDTFQIEVGSVTSIEPYNGTEVIIALGQTVYGGYVTQDKAGHRELVATWSKKSLSSNDFNWRYADTSFGYPIFYSNNNLPFVSTNITTLKWLSEIFKGTTKARNTLSDNEIGMWNVTTNSNQIAIRCDSITSLDDFTNAVQNYYLYYEMSEPIIIPLPDGFPLNVLIGTNNLFADSGDSECAYKESVELYVQKRIAEVQALVLG